MVNYGPSYLTSIIASTALITTAATKFYEGFNIRDPKQLIIYTIAGILGGVVLAKIGNSDKKSKLEIRIK